MVEPVPGLEPVPVVEPVPAVPPVPVPGPEPPDPAPGDTPATHAPPSARASASAPMTLGIGRGQWLEPFRGNVGFSTIPTDTLGQIISVATGYPWLTKHADNGARRPLTGLFGL